MNALNNVPLIIYKFLLFKKKKLDQSHKLKFSDFR